MKDDADREIAGYGALSGVLAVTAVGLAFLRHPLYGAWVMGAAFYGLYQTHKLAERRNAAAEPPEERKPSSLNGRLDIYRATGM